MIDKFKLGMIASDLVEDGKGILAADESPSSLETRFHLSNIENTEDNRRIYRESIFKAIKNHISGVILHDETFDMKTDDGMLLPDILKNKSIHIGIKLDKGLTDFNENEKLSIGLEDLDVRIKKEKYKCASFAKWRSVFHISENTPTKECIAENSRVLAEYAVIAQKNGLVPIVEPEIVRDGEYKIETCLKVTKRILSNVIYELNQHDVFLPGVLIKASFVTAGVSEKNDSLDVAENTIEALRSTIPCAIPGIVFLSGGHSSEHSFQYLNQLHKCVLHHTWKLTFSFGRALTDPFLKIWKGDEKNLNRAVEILNETIDSCGKACVGKL
ncbi:Fructose-bisphosphate aldolase [Dictyocoela muelleri]|nr:Fructose-bisphosphate aldolase [Dictyocoela muelleri]